MTDLAGNETELSAGFTTFDFTEPTLSYSINQETFRAGDTMLVSVSSEVLDAAPTLTLERDADSTPMNVSWSQSGAYVFSATVPAGWQDGSYSLGLSAQDPAGNATTVEGESVQIDTSLPVISGVSLSRDHQSSGAIPHHT